jgi:5-methylcytosine-specific restriction endonuclease McrA
LPGVVEAVRSGQVHLAGLRLLVPHLTADNHHGLLAEAAGKSKRAIEELVARLAPQPPVPALIRKLPERLSVAPATQPTLAAAAPSAAARPAAATELLPQREEHRPVIAPLAADAFRIQFTASRALRDKLRQAQDLMRHRVPDGDLATIVERALDLLIEGVTKERFATGRKPREGSKGDAGQSASRHIPDAIKRAVYERDGGRCTFADDRGHRCPETGALEFDHLDGFARTHSHEVARIRLLCRAHNQHAAEQTYGQAFMERARAAKAASTRPGTSSQTNML